MVAALAHAFRVVGSIGMVAVGGLLSVTIHMIAGMAHKSGSVILFIMLANVHFFQVIKNFYQIFRILRVKGLKDVILVKELI